MSTIAFTTPLGAAGAVSSGSISIGRALSVTGTVFADQAGTAYVDQGGDGVNWDFTTAISVTADTGVAIDVDVIDRFVQVRYVNGSDVQTIFRLFADLRDPYGAFLAAALPASPGGAYGILKWQSGSETYSFLGRFDGIDQWNAISNAALSPNGGNGKYAAFIVADAVVATEVVLRSTEHAADSF